MSERKRQILGLLHEVPWRTSSEVAWSVGLTLSNASELLRRYQKDSLVTRMRLVGPGAPPRAFAYDLTEKGEARLVWLEQHDWEVEYE